MAVKANLDIDQGTDFEATIDLNDSAGDAYDLTGYTVSSQMRKTYASSTAYDFTATHANTSGQITLTMDHTVTNDIPPGRYLYDVEIKSSANVVTRVVQGIVTVNGGITR